LVKRAYFATDFPDFIPLAMSTIPYARADDLLLLAMQISAVQPSAHDRRAAGEAERPRRISLKQALKERKAAIERLRADQKI
jgi:hypothetical protein